MPTAPSITTFTLLTRHLVTVIVMEYCFGGSRNAVRGMLTSSTGKAERPDAALWYAPAIVAVLRKG
jgi:hypothetical protein